LRHSHRSAAQEACAKISRGSALYSRSGVGDAAREVRTARKQWIVLEGKPMTDRPIIFSAPMVRALLDGRKTQTRRIVKLNGHLPEYGGPAEGFVDPTPELWGWETDDDWIPLVKEKPGETCYLDLATTYAPGDRLWVRETWRTAASVDALKPKKIEAACLDAGYRRAWAPIQYEADGARDNFTEGEPQPGKTRAAIHMPRWASRLTLIVEAVKVERLQAISEADAMAEGVSLGEGQMAGTFFVHGAGVMSGVSAVACFERLWHAINGAESGDENPWVVAITFRVVRANIDSPEEMAAE
jgi:hypothetical protein